MSDKELIKQDKESKCIYNRTLEERKKFCKYCSVACGVRIEEEPASKDLEEEIKSWIPAHIIGGDEYLRAVSTQWSEIVARHFAEWQKQQMKEALQTEYEKGRFDMREEMMKDAVEGDIFREIKSPSNIEFQLRSKRFKMEGIKLGDKVKIVVLKTD